MTYQVGQVVPLHLARAPLGEPIDLTWYLFRVPSQGEIKAGAWLCRIGAVEAWFPVETAWRIVPRAGRRKVKYQRRLAPGYVFAAFDRAPSWDVLFAQALSRLTSVVGRDGEIYPIPAQAMIHMRTIPKRLEALRDREIAREREERLKAAPVPGGKAVICEGTLHERIVDVTAIDKGIASFVLGRIEGQMPIDRMRGVA